MPARGAEREEPLRDVKPSNLFLTARPDGTPLVKVLDFGISKAPVSGRGVLTATATVMGTPGYMSPEQMKATRDVDARTDIWALGIVLYECLTGRRPFEAEAFSAVVLMVATEPVPPMDARVPRGLQGVVLRCLEKDRADRFASIAEFAAAVAPFARDQRAAGIVIERTKVLLQGPKAMGEPMIPPNPPQQGTTLQVTTGASPALASQRVRYAAIGTMTAVVAVLVTLSAVALTRAGRSDNMSEPPPAVAVTDDAAVAIAQHPLVKVDEGAPAKEDAAIPMARHSVGQSDDEQALKILKCTEVQAQKDWRALTECAKTLQKFGAPDKADEFFNKETREQQNAIFDTEARNALRSGKLKDAQARLRQIGNDSVYFKSLSDLFKRADNAAAEGVRSWAQALAIDHDCENLRRFVQVVIAGNSGTEHVANVLATVECVGNTATSPPANPRTAAMHAGSDSPNSSRPSTQPKNSYCDTMDVADIISQAQSQYESGFAKSALQIVTKALACKPDVSMYQLAVLYACVVHDATNANRYYTKLPGKFQTQMVLRCHQEGIDLSP